MPSSANVSRIRSACGARTLPIAVMIIGTSRPAARVASTISGRSRATFSGSTCAPGRTVHTMPGYPASRATSSPLLQSVHCRCRETSARVGPRVSVSSALPLPSAATAGAAAMALSTLLLVSAEERFSSSCIFIGVRIGELVVGDAQGPLDAFGHQLAELRIVPNLFAMADRLIEHPALAVILGPD